MKALSTSVVPVIILSYLLTGGAAVVAGPFYSERGGYSLHLPDDWVQVAPEVLAAEGTVDDSFYPLVLDAAFQRAAVQSGVDTPFVEAWISAEPDPSLNRHLGTSDLLDLCDLLSPEQMAAARQQLADGGKFALPNGWLSSLHPDPSRRRVSYTLEFRPGEETGLQVSAATFFGRDSTALLVFVASKGDGERYAPVRGRLFDSFRFDPDRAYVAASAVPLSRRPAQESDSSGPPDRSVQLMVLILVLIVIRSAQRSRKKSKEAERARREGR